MTAPHATTCPRTSDLPFAVGDAVRRTGGGPEMTVVQVDPAYYAYRVGCQWSEGGSSRMRFFRAEDLEPAAGE